MTKTQDQTALLIARKLDISKLKSQKELMKKNSEGGQHIVYGYLRAKASGTGKAGSPYYVGIGNSHTRPYQEHTRGGKRSKAHNVPVPKDESLVRQLGTFPTRAEAAKREQELIARYGRKGLDDKGILLNRSIGGEASALGVKRSLSTRKKNSEAAKKRDAAKHLKAQREAASKEKAAKLGIPWSKYEKMTLGERATAADRVRRGVSWDGPLVSQKERSQRRVEARQRNYAKEIGIPYELWSTFEKKRRNTITARYRRGVRGAALLEGLL